MPKFTRLQFHGLNRDATPELAQDAWQQADNVVFSEGTAEPFRRFSRVWAGVLPLPLNTAPRYLWHAGLATGTWWVAGYASAAATGKIFSFSGDSAASVGVTDQSPVTWTAADLSARGNIWSGGSLNGFYFLNVAPPAGLVPCYGNSAASPLALMTAAMGWVGTTTCYAMRSYRNYVIAMNFLTLGGAFPDDIAWTNGAAVGAFPTTWVPAAANDAGSTTLGDSPSPIVDGIEAGRSFFIFKSSSTYRMTYIGGQEVMAFERVSSVAGAAALNCAARLHNGVALLTGDDVVMIAEDGRIRSLAEGKVRRRIFSLMGADYLSESFVNFNAASNHLWVFIHGSAAEVGCRYAFVLDLASGDWSEVEPEFETAGGVIMGLATCAGAGPGHDGTAGLKGKLRNMAIGFPRSSGTVNFVVLNEPTASAASGDYGQIDGDSIIRRNNLDLGDPTIRKLITGVRILGDFETAGEPLSLTIYGARSLNGPRTTYGPYSVIATVTDRIATQAEGRYFDIELKSVSDLDYEPWRVSGFDIEYEPEGRW